MQHHNGVAHATSQRSHGNISSQQLKGKRDARLEMVRDAHGSAPGRRRKEWRDLTVCQPGAGASNYKPTELSEVITSPHSLHCALTSPGETKGIIGGCWVRIGG